MTLSTILASEFAVQIVYPFLLIFTLMFAILQKSKILGDGKAQIDALVSLAISLIVIAFNWATDIITNLMPFLAVTIVAILVFLIIWGFVAADKEKGLEVPNWVKISAFVVAVIVVIIALIVSAGQWDRLYNSLFGSQELNDFWTNAVLVIVIVVALVIVVLSGKKQ